MDRFYSYQLGRYDGRPYHLSVCGEPSLNDVDAFAVTVHYDDPRTEETVEIARIDTNHDTVHFDRLYRECQPKDPLAIRTPWEAEERLREHWRQYAESYASNHE